MYNRQSILITSLIDIYCVKVACVPTQVLLRTRNENGFLIYLWTLHFCIAINAEVKRSLACWPIAIAWSRNRDFLKRKKQQIVRNRQNTL